MTFSLTITTPRELAEESRRRIRKRLRRRRDQVLAAGITLNGISVQTDDRSQHRIFAAAFAATQDPDLTVNWKTAAGDFVRIDAPTLIALAQAVRAHVQDCYDHESALLTALEAGENVDLDDGWPQRR
jgi:hypothetical protein